MESLNEQLDMRSVPRKQLRTLIPAYQKKVTALEDAIKTAPYCQTLKPNSTSRTGEKWRKRTNRSRTT
jgi:hypothetical protein